MYISYVCQVSKILLVTNVKIFFEFDILKCNYHMLRQAVAQKAAKVTRAAGTGRPGQIRALPGLGPPSVLSWAICARKDLGVVASVASAPGCEARARHLCGTARMASLRAALWALMSRLIMRGGLLLSCLFSIGDRSPETHSAFGDRRQLSQVFKEGQVERANGMVAASR